MSEEEVVQEVEQYGQDTTQLSTLLLPVSGKQLILPNVTVAEVVHYSEPEKFEDDDFPDWLLGFTTWREQQVPVMSFELFNESPIAPDSANLRLAIINGAKSTGMMPFYAIITEGAPRLLRVDQDEIKSLPDAELSNGDLMAVSCAGEDAVIPNLELLEDRLLEHM